MSRSIKDSEMMGMRVMMMVDIAHQGLERFKEEMGVRDVYRPEGLTTADNVLRLMWPAPQ